MSAIPGTSAYGLSLASRVLSFVALSIAVSLSLLWFLVTWSIDRHFAQQDAAELGVVASAVANRISRTNANELPLANSLKDAVSGHHDVYFALYDSSGQLLYTSLSGAWADPPQCTELGRPLDPGQLFVWHADGRTFRGAGFYFNAAGKRFRIVSAVDIGFHLTFLAEIRRTLLILVSVSGVLIMLAAWHGVHQGHAPLRKLEQQVVSIGSDQLHQRLPTAHVPTELLRLVQSFNEMIGRLDHDFRRVANFADDIAHELRTPLTNLVTQTQVALAQQRSAEEYRETLYSNLEEYERLSRMVNDILWLAKSEHGLFRLKPAVFDLTSEAKSLVEYFSVIAEEKNIRLEVEDVPAPVFGDREMIRRALFNLLSNALRHTPVGGEISVRAKRLENSTELSVENTGVPIGPEHLPRLFDRFYQVDVARREGDGAGLGLAIVKSVVERHSGEVRAFSENGRTRFSLSLPKAIVPKAGPVAPGFVG